MLRLLVGSVAVLEDAPLGRLDVEDLRCQLHHLFTLEVSDFDIVQPAVVAVAFIALLMHSFGPIHATLEEGRDRGHLGLGSLRCGGGLLVCGG